MSTQPISLKSMAARVLLACALFVLPLGPFTWSQARAAEGAGTTGTAVTAPALTVDHASHVAMGQPLGISVMLVLPDPDAPAPENSSAGQGGRGAATDSPATSLPTYKATLSFKDQADAMLIHELDSKYLAPGTAAVFENLASSTWAKVGKTEFIVGVAASDGSVSLEKSFYITVEPAFRTATFDLNVDAKDPNQPSKLAEESIQVTYGRPYSYVPGATDATDATAATRALPAPTRPNYDFAGWYTGYNAETGTYSGKVEDDTVFTGTGDVALYAKWTGKQYTVRLDGYDYKGEKRGTLSPWSVTVSYGETYAALAKVTGTGITGDNTELRGFTTDDGTVVKPEDVVDSSLYDWQTGPLTLYPVWGTARESLEGAVVEGLAATYGYTGSAIVPELTVTIPAHKDAEGKDVPAKTLQKGRDYTVACTDNVEISAAGGQARMVIEGAGAYKGSISKSFRIVQGTPFFQVNGQVCGSGSEAVELPFSGSGSIQVAAKLVTDAASGVAYSLAFADVAAAGEAVLDDYAAIDAATGVVTVKRPLGEFTLRVSATASAGTKFTATPATGVSCLLLVGATSLRDCTVSLGATSYAYNGKVRKPSVTVKSPSGVKLAAGVDYSVKYASGRKAVGSYKVTVTGMGGYEGSVSKSFTIVPKGCGKLKAAKTSQTTKYKGKAYRVYKLSWSKVSGIDGYQVKRTVDKSSTSTFKPSKTSERYAWPKGKTVKVQVRTYKKAGSKKHYSAWKTISVKVK